MKSFALIVLLACTPLAACMMIPLGYTGDVDQSAQQVVILHRAANGDTPGYQEMMIKVQPFFQGAESNPEYAVWVITVPNKPLRYDIADKDALAAGQDMHARLFQLARRQWASRTQFAVPASLLVTSGSAKGRDEVIQAALEVDDIVEVGPYTITPVRATGANAVAELNDYLRERGFPQEDPGHVQYFIDNDFTFLCIKVSPQAGHSTLGKALDLPSLVLGFETDRPYYPGKFSSRQGNFALDLTVVSDKPLETDSVAEAVTRLMATSHGQVQLVNLFSVKPLPEGLASGFGDRAKADDPSRWYVNRIQSEGFNPTVDGKPAIAGWGDDVFFKIGDTTDELPGFWYYGDQDINWFERFFREHALGLFVSIGLFGFITLFIKTRINRRRLQAHKPTA